MKAIHERNARLMISVWGKFYPGTDNFDALQAKGYLYQPPLQKGYKDWVGKGYPYTFYDAFDAGARELFWSQLNRDAVPPRRRRLVDGRERARPGAADARARRCSGRTCTRRRSAPARAC